MQGLTLGTGNAVKKTTRLLLVRNSHWELGWRVTEMTHEAFLGDVSAVKKIKQSG